MNKKTLLVQLMQAAEFYSLPAIQGPQVLSHTERGFDNSGSC